MATVEDDPVPLVVVGGGLSGMMALYTLLTQLPSLPPHRRPSSLRLLEASPHRLGGRAAASATGVDLGGAWLFGGGASERTRALAVALGVRTMLQPGSDDGQNALRRVEGGLVALVTALRDTIVQLADTQGVRVHFCLGCRLVSITGSTGGADVTTTTATATPPKPDTGGQQARAGSSRSSTSLQPAPLRLTVESVASADASDTDCSPIPGHVIASSAPACAVSTVITADYVLLAVPPRLALATIAFHPPLERSLATTLAAQPTWMSATGKVALTYAAPWWRTLPDGHDIHNLRPPRPGPVVQLMDASTAADRHYVLVAFIAPGDGETDWRSAAVAQVTRLQTLLSGGRAAIPPLGVTAKLWRDDVHVFAKSGSAESNDDYAHPEPLPVAAGVLFSGRVRLCASEMDTAYPGYIEGAIRAGEAAGHALVAEWAHAKDAADDDTQRTAVVHGE